LKKKFKTIIVLDHFDKIIESAPKSIYHILGEFIFQTFFLILKFKLDSGHFKDINLAIICITNDYVRKKRKKIKIYLEEYFK